LLIKGYNYPLKMVKCPVVYGHLYAEIFLNGDGPAQTANEALESFYIKLIPVAEGIDDLGPGVPFFGVRLLWAN